MILTQKRTRPLNSDQTRINVYNKSMRLPHVHQMSIAFVNPKKMRLPNEDKMRIDFGNQKEGGFQMRTTFGLLAITIGLNTSSL